ncbi:Transglycosylase SLT domain-containing protein [Sphingopyxis sp. YR583]|nr:Transglycosylase SLT domain-containing protein [Sphingopyxis sp. YR583]
MRRARFALLAGGLVAVWSSTAVFASPSPVAASASLCARHAVEAAQRSQLAAETILRVMHVESRGRPDARSHKGAMGCMQIMPATWRYLTGKHGLGADPWDPRMNMIGGALYLAELARQFGFPGAYSAYNAGPARYARHVATGAPLPRETQLYTASLTRAPHAPRSPSAAASRQPRARWQEATLFMAGRGRGVNASTERAAEVAASAAGISLFPLAKASEPSTGNSEK